MKSTLRAVLLTAALGWSAIMFVMYLQESAAVCR